MMRFVFVVGTVTVILFGAWASMVSAWMRHYDESPFRG